MRLDKLDGTGVMVFGDTTYRGACPAEKMEQMTFFNQLRLLYPDTLGKLATHPRNEGLVSRGQFNAMARYKAEGMSPGAADIIIPGAPAFVCELKRLDHTKSAWQPGQIEYLTTAAKIGAFTCIALGHAAALEAVEAWKLNYWAGPPTEVK